MGDKLSPDNQAFVDELIRAGRCADADEAIDAALRRWREEEILAPWTEERLREELAIGLRQLDRGEYSDFTAEDIIREGRERLKERADRRGGATT